MSTVVQPAPADDGTTARSTVVSQRRKVGRHLNDVPADTLVQIKSVSRLGTT